MRQCGCWMVGPEVAPVQLCNKMLAFVNIQNDNINAAFCFDGSAKP